MKSRILYWLLIVVLAAVTSTAALGQQNVFFETPEACVIGPAAYYLPVDTSRLAAWQEKVQHGAAQVIKYDHDTCFRGSTAMGERIYKAPANTPFFSTDGVNAEADGRCGNEGVVVGHVPATTPPAPAEPATAEPATAPAEPATAEPATATVGLDPVVPWVAPVASTTPRRSVLDQFAGEDEPEREGLCETSPGVKSLWVGGWLLRQPVCHPKRTTLFLAGAAAAYTGTAYGLGLWPFKGKAATTTTKPPGPTPAACTLLYQLGICPNKGPGGKCPNECV